MTLQSEFMLTTVEVGGNGDRDCGIYGCCKKEVSPQISIPMPDGGEIERCPSMIVADCLHVKNNTKTRVFHARISEL